MKLLTKTTLYIATLSLFLFFLMGIVFYQVLKTMSINELNWEIKGMRESVEKRFPMMIEYGITELPGIDTLIINRTNNTLENPGEFRDTMMFDTHSDQYLNFKIYSFTIPTDDINYKVELYKSTTPTDKLVEKVTIMMTLMVVLFLTGIFFLNRYISNNLWKDFFIALNKLKRFSAEEGPLSFHQSDIQEFNELNMVLENITKRLSDDYRELKEYTDHTTHELQTPLAIIKSRVELLLQSESLKKAEIELLKDIYRNSDHLSRLNSTLTLFTRIENQQYTEKTEINITKLICSLLEMLQELIELKNIVVTKNISNQDIIVNMDKGLAEVLIINLLKNAVNHNIDEGTILITSTNQRLVLRNSGAETGHSPEKLFEPFYRGAVKSDSLGLGLPLVKKICENYGFSIEYEYKDGMHSFTINFS